MNEHAASAGVGRPPIPADLRETAREISGWALMEGIVAVVRAFEIRGLREGV
jgi:hypothetical protein